MKKIMFVSMMVFVLCIAACASGQQKSDGSKTTVRAALFNESWELPCQMYDDDDYFATVGMATGSMDQKAELQKTALANAQDICRQKVKQEYWDLEEENQIVDTFINNAQAKCVKYSNIMEDGKIEVYVGIKVPKRELAEKIVNEVLIEKEEKSSSPNLVAEKEPIYFDDAKYRERMEKRFQEFQKENAEKESGDEAVKLTEEEKAQITFNEAEFRKKLDEAFEKYKGKDAKKEEKAPSTCVSEAHQTTSLGESWELPCQMYDDDDYFTAIGIAKGDIDEKGRLQELALYDARRIVEWKVRPVYYSMGVMIAMKVNELLTDKKKEDNITDKIRKAGDSVIKTTIKNAQAECVKYSGITEDGMIEAYVGIKISRRKLAEEMLREIRKVLSEEEKNRISFDEEIFRERMIEKLRQYNKETEEKHEINFHEEDFREKAKPEKTEEK